MLQITTDMKYTVIIKKDPESGWYVGRCAQIPGAVSQGETFAELMENMKDAISLVLEYNSEKARMDFAGQHVFYRNLELA